MKAFVLAAGVGSRLRPLTDSVPKALIDVGGLPMVERVLRRLEAAGVTEAVVNAHHHADKLASYLSNRGGALKITVSREDDLLLDTGGGLKKARALLDAREPFFVHNADVLTDVDLGALRAAHGDALATLFVQDRPTKRKLLFSPDLRLLGRAAEGKTGTALGFNGVQIVSPRIFDLMSETGVFSLTDVYARLAPSELIRGRRDDAAKWFDVGSPEKLEAARRWAASA